MKWSSRPVSKHGDWLRKLRDSEGIKVKSLEDEPTLYSHLLWIWQAFSDLSFRRGAGMSGPLAITFSDIQSYCLLFGIIEASDKERLVRLIGALDRAYISAAYEKNESAADSFGSKAGRDITPPPPSATGHRTQVPREPRRAPTREVV